MKNTFFLVPLLSCVLAVTAASARSQPLGSLGPPMLGAVAAGISTLSIMPVGYGGPDLVWAAWDEYRGPDHDVHLALLRHKGRSVTPVWSRKYAEGYAPAIDNVLGWQLNGHFVLMLRFQFGAAYQHVEFYGFSKSGGVRALGSLEGVTIEPVVMQYSGTVVRVWGPPDIKGPEGCTGLDTTAGKLVPRPCPS